ncbi:MAG: vWA domain-containing protein [Pseudomonadota bacterium]
MIRFCYIVILITGLSLPGAPLATAAAPENDTVILLANSETMNHSDPDSSMLEAVTGFLQGTAASTRVTILSFSGHVSLVAPFTTVTPQTIAELIGRLKTIKPSGQHSNIAAGIERSIHELRKNARPGTNKNIILITDTTIQTGDQDRDRNFEKWLREILLEEAAEANIRFFSVAIGAKADIQSLQLLASRTGGDYFRASNADEIEPALDKIHLMLAGGMVQSAQADRTAPPANAPSSTALSPELTVIADIDPSDHQPRIPDHDLSSQTQKKGQPPADEIQQRPEPLSPESEIGDFRPSPLTSTIGRYATQWLSDTLILSLIALAMLTLTGLGFWFVFKGKRRLIPTLRTMPSAKTMAANATHAENTLPARSGTEEFPVRPGSDSDPFVPTRNHTNITAPEQPTLLNKKEPEAPLGDGRGDTEELADLMPEQATAQPPLEDTRPRVANAEHPSASFKPAGRAAANPANEEDDKTTLRPIDK